MSIFSFICLFFFIISCEIDLNLLKSEQYQDIFVNGQILKNGVRVCESRFKLIEEFLLKKFKRQFTLIDLGAAQGYFSLNAAYKYNCCSVMVEGNNHYADFLKYLCEQNDQVKSKILLHQQIDNNFLKLMARGEHFDVVLALNIIHHLGQDWQECLEHILNLGEHIIIETPSGKDQGACGIFNREIEQYLNDIGAQIIGCFPKHTDSVNHGIMYYIHRKKNTVMQKYLLDFYWLGPKNSYIIDSNLDYKKFTKFDNNQNLVVSRNWHPGINFVTFKIFNGIYPNTNWCESAINNVFDHFHQDFMPWNLVLNGSNMYLIDGEEKTEVCAKFGLNVCLEFNKFYKSSDKAEVFFGNLMAWLLEFVKQEV
jgi:2-polyprenyl-3-methyl-5-hydroxy-6-metoxy-1,4-benzoquinol methylase